MNSPHYFVAGFPGVLAQKTIARLCGAGARVSMLTASAHKTVARRFAKNLGATIDVLEGSPHQIDFGLVGEQYRLLAESVTGILDLGIPSMHRVDTASGADGLPVQEFIELALSADRLELLLCMSAHTVAGDFEGNFAEYDTNDGGRSGGSMVQGLAQKERVLRRFGDKMPIVLIRTGWVISSETGEGICPIVPLLFGLRFDARHKIADQSLMLTPLSALADFVEAVVKKGKDVDLRCFHYFDTRKITVDELFQRLSSMARQFVPASFDLHRGAERLLSRKDQPDGWGLTAFWNMLPWGARFANRATTRFCESEGLALPRLNDQGMNKLVEQSVEELSGFK